MSQIIIDEFTKAVKAKLREAFDIYGITVPVDSIRVRCDIRGQVAGWASGKPRAGGMVYGLRFNHEAILNHNEEMTKDTIPHEVAHIVCYIKPQLGRNHDFGWKAVCRRLGGDDSRTHDMVLTPAKIVPSRRQKYNLPDGRVCEVGPKHHRMIQGGCTTIFMRNPKTFLRAEMWEHYGDLSKMPVAQPQQVFSGLNIVRSDIPASQPGASKRERAEAIYKANRGLERKDMINLFVLHAEMTKAGAATYYQTFKSKGI